MAEDFILEAGEPDLPLPRPPRDTEENIAFLEHNCEVLLGHGAAVLQWQFYGADLILHDLRLLRDDFFPAGIQTLDLAKMKRLLETRLRLAGVTEMQGWWIWELLEEKPPLRLRDARPPE